MRNIQYREPTFVFRSYQFFQNTFEMNWDIIEDNKSEIA